MNTDTITKDQAEEIRTRCKAHDSWVDSIRGKNGWASYKPEDKPAHVPDVSNDERSALEVWDFVNNPPDRYFLYIKEDTRTATTWTGDRLGSVDFGSAFLDNFGGTSVPVTVRAVNGKTYHGTWYKSAGDYARIKLAKRQPSRRDIATV